MRLLWNEVKRIEQFLKGKRIAIPHKAVEEQRAVYRYIKLLGRRSLKKEIQAVEKKYFR